MSKWKYKIEMGQSWKEYHQDQITIQELGIRLANELILLQRRLHKSIKWEEVYLGDYFKLEELAEEFKCIEDVEEFDNWLDELYDFADRYRIWIATF